MKNKYPLLYVEWLDCISPVKRGWRTEEEALIWGRTVDFMVKEVGWLIEETKDYILLAARFNITTEDKDEFISLGELCKIPKGWIKKRKLL